MNDCSTIATGSQEGTGVSKDTAGVVMLSAAGRRVGLLRCLQQSLENLGHADLQVLATDITRQSASMHVAVRYAIVPAYSDPDCLKHLLKLCEQNRVRLIIPTIDPDLPFYAKHHQAFRDVGTQIMVSSPDTIDICNNKNKTHAWLAKHGFPVPKQISASALTENSSQWVYPLFAKPAGGSSSVGIQTVHSLAELKLLAGDQDYIVQEIARGLEYTVDVYVDKVGRCRCAVPRLRLETRGGEVVKGMTVRNPLIEETACRIAETLPGAWGVMNIQMFYDQASQHLAVIEINARFGGGYPLTHAAGAPMTRWVLEELTGRELTARNDQWIDGLVMLRYDDAVYVSREEADVDLVKLAKAKQGTK